MNQKGIILITVTVIMAAVLLLISYFFQMIVVEKKIAQSNNLATIDYYLAEAGVNQALWKISNNASWLNEFQTNPSWQTQFTVQNPLGNGGNYQVQINNVDLGQAEISAVSKITYSNVEAQRIVKITAFQAQGEIFEGATTSAIFADRDINFSGTILEVIGGGLFANDDINLTFFSEIDVQGTAEAVDDITIPWGSYLNATEKKADNFPPAPENREMPQIDFDSEDSNSLKNRADYVYTTGQFQSLLNNNENLNLTGIIYVTGNINFPRGVSLTVNGALVSEGHINLGTEWWPLWEDSPRLTINDLGTGPAGIIAARRIYFAQQAQEVNIDGLMYSVEEIRADYLSPNINLEGGIIARDINFSNFFNPITITHNEETILRTLGMASESPVINVDHWEEEY